VDAAGLDERLVALGVVVLLDCHERDAVTIANRHGVPVTRPPGVERDLDAPVDRVTAGSPEPTTSF
jgi:hypothetical protein